MAQRIKEGGTNAFSGPANGGQFAAKQQKTADVSLGGTREDYQRQLEDTPTLYNKDYANMMHAGQKVYSLENTVTARSLQSIAGKVKDRHPGAEHFTVEVSDNNEVSLLDFTDTKGKVQKFSTADNQDANIAPLLKDVHPYGIVRVGNQKAPELKISRDDRMGMIFGVDMKDVPENKNLEVSILLAKKLREEAQTSYDGVEDRFARTVMATGALEILAVHPDSEALEFTVTEGDIITVADATDRIDSQGNRHRVNDQEYFAEVDECLQDIPKASLPRLIDAEDSPLTLVDGAEGKTFKLDLKAVTR